MADWLVGVYNISAKLYTKAHSLTHTHAHAPSLIMETVDIIIEGQ